MYNVMHVNLHVIIIFNHHYNFINLQLSTEQQLQHEFDFAKYNSVLAGNPHETIACTVSMPSVLRHPLACR